MSSTPIAVLSGLAGRILGTLKSRYDTDPGLNPLGGSS